MLAIVSILTPARVSAGSNRSFWGHLPRWNVGKCCNESSCVFLVAERSAAATMGGVAPPAPHHPLFRLSPWIFSRFQSWFARLFTRIDGGFVGKYFC